mmetsp:Transcript_19599/g.42829  ORF Transcript_19599/g.42829 Transcript_19599/m.42829 type:complete len:491 (-) Transcript_19599:82-1554(-)
MGHAKALPGMEGTRRASQEERRIVRHLKWALSTQPHSEADKDGGHFCTPPRPGLSLSDPWVQWEEPLPFETALWEHGRPAPTGNSLQDPTHWNNVEEPFSRSHSKSNESLSEPSVHSATNDSGYCSGPSPTRKVVVAVEPRSEEKPDDEGVEEIEASLVPLVPWAVPRIEVVSCFPASALQPTPVAMLTPTSVGTEVAPDAGKFLVDDFHLQATPTSADRWFYEGATPLIHEERHPQEQGIGPSNLSGLSHKKLEDHGLLSNSLRKGIEDSVRFRWPDELSGELSGGLAQLRDLWGKPREETRSPSGKALLPKAVMQFEASLAEVDAWQGREDLRQELLAVLRRYRERLRPNCQQRVPSPVSNAGGEPLAAEALKARCHGDCAAGPGRELEERGGCIGSSKTSPRPSAHSKLGLGEPVGPAARCRSANPQVPRGLPKQGVPRLIPRDLRGGRPAQSCKLECDRRWPASGNIGGPQRCCQMPRQQERMDKY